jgi:ribosomal 50S subunit-associated protein YjgA (DUF615 family)
MCTKNAHWGENNYNIFEEEERECKESTKSVTRVVCVKLRTLAQSNKELKNKELTKAPLSWSIELTLSSKIRLLHSVQSVHIKYKGTV